MLYFSMQYTCAEGVRILVLEVVLLTGTHGGLPKR